MIESLIEYSHIIPFAYDSDQCESWMRQFEPLEAQLMGIIDCFEEDINPGSYINIAASISYHIFPQSQCK